MQHASCPEKDACNMFAAVRKINSEGNIPEVAYELNKETAQNILQIRFRYRML
jgi:hypothetical protein